MLQKASLQSRMRSLQTQISGKLSGFSTERLFRFLNALGCDIEIVVRKKQSDSEAKTKVCID
jgi:Helix-turn-helix domain